MSEVECVRCGLSREGLPKPPWPGEQGNRIYENVCETCWSEWKAHEVKVINEYRLNLANREHAKLLDREMMVFLDMAEGEESEAEELGEAPYGFGEGGPEGTGQPPPG